MSHVVDIVFCIDCTGSMSPVLDASKALAMGFHDELKRDLEEQQKTVDQLSRLLKKAGLDAVSRT